MVSKGCGPRRRGNCLRLRSATDSVARVASGSSAWGRMGHWAGVPVQPAGRLLDRPDFASRQRWRPGIRRGANTATSRTKTQHWRCGLCRLVGALWPQVQALKDEEAGGFVPRPKRPRVLVLGPTKELTEQITAVAKRLCHTAKFRAACVNANKRCVGEGLSAAGTCPVAGAGRGWC